MKINKSKSPIALLAFIATLGFSGSLLDAQTWNGTLSNATESWNVDANWNPGTFPNAVGASANLSVDLTANKIINLQQGITLGTLTMGDSSGTSTLTIATGTGTNTLAFDAASGNATLATSGGSNTISAGIALTDSVDMTLGSALTISGSISGSGTLNKLATASGLTLSGNNTGWTGGIVNRQGTINMTGTATNVTLGTGTFTFANANGGSGNTLASNAAASKTITNNFIQNNADIQTGTEYAQISISGGSSGYRVLTFTGNFSTGANFYGGNATNANGQSLFLNAQSASGNATNESSFVFTGDWSGYNGTSGGLATTNAQAIRLQSGSYVFDASAASASASSGFQLQSTDATVSGKLILSEDGTTLANGIQFTNASGQRHSFGSIAGTNSTVTASGTMSVSAALGAAFFAQNATGKLIVSGLVSGAGAGGIEINKSYTYTSADSVNSLQTPTGTVVFSRAAGNTYSAGTAVTAGTLLVTNTSGSATGNGSVSVMSAATLGGTGIIAPTGTNGITVSSGGFIAPGTTAIGTLTIGLSNTTGTVSMTSGSGFHFKLGTANAGITSITLGSSDRITLTGASTADFAFNSNNIDFLGTGAGEGFYKLFDTDFGATTWTGLTFDPTSGLVSAGLTGSNLANSSSPSFYVGTIGNSGDLGDIYLEVVPEPSVVALLAVGFATFFILRHRRATRAPQSV
jgi:hypothetical protein